MAVTTHQIRQRPPLRALVLATVLGLVGILLMLMADLLGRQLALTIVGVVVAGLGLGLFAAAWLQARSMGVRIDLDDEGYRLEGAIRPASGAWSDVAKVTRGADRITLQRKDGSRLQLVVARGGRADLDALSADVAARLDADRGYARG